MKEQAGLDHSLLLHQIMWTLSQQNSVLEMDVLEDCSDDYLKKKKKEATKPALVEFFSCLFLNVSHYFKNPFLFVWQNQHIVVPPWISDVKCTSGNVCILGAVLGAFLSF